MATSATAVFANQIPGSLEQPAQQSALATRSLVTAVDYAGDRLVAVGERGHILLSDDQGGSWQQAEQVPVTVTLTDVCFDSDREGWAVGHRGAILHTRDAGATWQLQYDGFRAAEDLLEVLEKAGSEQAFYAEMMVEDGADKPFLGVRCLGDRQVIAYGAYGFAFRTVDGGVEWAPSAAVFDGTMQMHIYDTANGDAGLYMAGERGGLYRTDDTLTDFETLSAPYEGTFFGVLETTGDTVLVWGLRGHAFRSENQGQSWTELDLDTQQSLGAGLELSGNRVLLVDNAGQGWLSLDGGHSFRLVTANRGFPITDLIELSTGDVLGVGARGFVQFSGDTLE